MSDLHMIKIHDPRRIEH